MFRGHLLQTARRRDEVSRRALNAPLQPEHAKVRESSPTTNRVTAAHGQGSQRASEGATVGVGTKQKETRRVPIDPKDFFLEYVLEPYDAWINQELCKWKAMAVANGLNALMEVKFLHDNPTRTVKIRITTRLWGPSVAA